MHMTQTCHCSVLAKKSSILLWYHFWFFVCTCPFHRLLSLAHTFVLSFIVLTTALAAFVYRSSYVPTHCVHLMAYGGFEVWNWLFFGSIKMTFKGNERLLPFIWWFILFPLPLMALTGQTKSIEPNMNSSIVWPIKLIMFKSEGRCDRKINYK